MNWRQPLSLRDSGKQPALQVSALPARVSPAQSLLLSFCLPAHPAAAEVLRKLKVKHSA